MNTPLPPLTTPATKAGSFTRFAAIGSLLTPFAALSIYALALLPLGVILGGLALTRVKQQVNQALFWFALTGVCLNALLILAGFAAPYVILKMTGNFHPLTPAARLAQASQTLTAATGENRFYALDDAAKESFAAGHLEDARKHANELLSRAPGYANDWNYGNAIQDGNLVLGRIAVTEGHLDEAKRYLLASGNSKGSPQMNSFGPNMSLAKDLLEKGERDAVLQYFVLCRKFWQLDYGKLDEWTQAVKAGQIPDFGANLLY